MSIGKEVLQRSFWALPVSEALNILETTRTGLTDEQVAARRATFKKNVLPQTIGFSWLKIFLRQFKSPLLGLLLIAGGLSLFLGHFTDAAVIFAAAFANVIFGFYQENKAERALAHLRTYIKEKSRAFRNGQEIEVDAADLVPGDIIHLAQGDRVPADCRLIYINDLMVDEAILTGESLPVAKTLEPASFKTVLADRKSMVFSGTLVVQGFGNAVVVTTGQETELGKIAGMVAATKKEQTPLQSAIFRFSIKTSGILIVLTAAVFTLGIFYGKPLLDMFLIAVAIAVSAVPEGLPVALTVILAIGVQRLAKKSGVVRKLLAAETLGNTTVILTDKTGTLTQAKMELSKITLFSDAYSRQDVLKMALLNTDVVIENPKESPDLWRIIGRPLEVALVKAAARGGVFLPEVKKELESLDFLPFTSKNKYSASIVENGPEFNYRVVAFGAPDVLIQCCTLENDKKEDILREVNKMAYSGERVLGIAIRRIKSKEKISLREKSSLEEMEFLATVSFRDPVRPSAKEAIAKVNLAGVRTMIITGDHRGTAESVAKELGFSIGGGQVIDGVALDSMDDAELKEKLLNLKIIARISPEGKVRVAKAFKEMGEIVAMTGDGINDAASLKEANIGIAMGSGTDVAKDVSDLVLLDDNFSTIVSAVEEGRRILENIRKVIVYLFSSLFDEMLLIGGAILLGLSLPISAIQILFVNFIADTFPALALAFEDRVDFMLLHKKRKRSINLFDKEMIFLVLAIGIPTSILLFGVYYFLNGLGLDPDLVRTFIFASFASYSLFVIFSVRSLRRPIFAYNPFSNPLLIIGVLLGLATIGAVVYLPFLQNFLGTVALPLEWLAGVGAIGIINILAIEIGKWIAHKWKFDED
ncbi:MAG: HAD-IC family P-type ATPase [Candidatus Harrisonbacteria bacterium]|nr:HAD-IC family P-type ATPase [Candidatus Harrisonbacteria bacterium]